jgi:hypothetical protein
MTQSVGIVAPLILTGASEITVGTWKAPSKAKKIEAIEVIFAASGGETAAQGETAYARITCSDTTANVEPCYLLSDPIGSCVGASAFGGGTVQERAIYPVNIPVNGGETFTVLGAELAALTIHGELSVNFFYNDTGADYNDFEYLGQTHGQFHWKIGTYTTTGTGSAAGTAATGTAYTVTGGKKIKVAIGIFQATTVASNTGAQIRFTLTSPDFKSAFPIDFMGRPYPGVLAGAATISVVAYRNVIPVDMDINSPCTVTDATTIYAAGAITAGKWITSIGYQ